jgi:predicted amidohydrolase YtcJ
MPADVVFRVGRAYGMTAERRIYQAVAVTDGRITAVGLGRDELDSFIGPGTTVIDDPELVLYPAFADTHNHQLLAARELDAASDGHPVFVQRGGHVGVANSAALRMAGITATSADPPSGTVVRLGDGTPADLLDVPVDDLPSQQPALTLVGGRPVHDPDGLLGAA